MNPEYLRGMLHGLRFAANNPDLVTEALETTELEILWTTEAKIPT